MPPIVVNASTIGILKRSQFESIQDPSLLIQILQQLLLQQQTGQQDFRRAEQALQQLEIRNGFETHIMVLLLIFFCSLELQFFFEESHPRCKTTITITSSRIDLFEKQRD